MWNRIPGTRIWWLSTFFSLGLTISLILEEFKFHRDQINSPATFGLYFIFTFIPLLFAINFSMYVMYVVAIKVEDLIKSRRKPNNPDPSIHSSIGIRRGRSYKRNDPPNKKQ